MCFLHCSISPSNNCNLLSLKERSITRGTSRNTTSNKLLFSRNTYGLTNDIEGHAEVYRYIGQQMPEQLKQYYPRLFENATDSSRPVESKETISGKKANIIPEPAPGTKTIIDQKVLPIAVSSGDVNILCGSCSSVLFQGMAADTIFNMVVKCPKCGSFNEV